MIRENKHIKGIFVNNDEHKLSQYADDTEFLLAGDRESFETCITVIDNFGRKSGLYMNAGKTSAVWLGSKRNSVVKYMQHLGMDWNPPKFKVLGIWFTNDLDNCEKKLLLRKVCRSKMYTENIDTKAYYITWQSCSFKISCSVEAYGFCYQTHQMNTLIVYKNCAMNLYGIKSRTTLIEKHFTKAYKKEALVFLISKRLFLL